MGSLQFHPNERGLMMKPERENDLVDLLDRLLNKGIILNADIIISVAGVPLIGVNLKAALASIETMLDYGMMEAWDQSTREWYAKEFAKKATVPLTEGEDIFLRTFGSIWHSQGIIHAWRPGFWYLTNKRLLLWRKEPAEMLFEVPLKGIEGLMVSREIHLKKEREEIYLRFDCGEVARIHVSNTTEFKEALESVGVLEKEFSIPCERVPLPEGEKIVLEKKLEYLFPAQGILGETWRPGYFCFTNKRLYWIYKLDNQKMFEVPIDKVASVAIRNDKFGVKREKEKILAIAYDGKDALFRGKEEIVYHIKTEIEKLQNIKPEKVLIA
jgi:hypothetical protein